MTIADAVQSTPTAGPGVPRLTSLAHGGGCGCKIAPALLTSILRRQTALPVPPELLVGTETSDDAAVYRLTDDLAIIATTDFFMPVVDDPFDFGRIAATNAISDIYAMGGRPILALAIVGMPIDKLPPEVIGAILRGGESVCAEAGIPVAGGHSIDSVEPIYGLVVLGLGNPRTIKRNSTARPGDALILGKPLGVGLYSAAYKKGALSADGYRQLIETTTQLNRPGAVLAEMPDVHALTDVTGFGLAGHTLEIARAASLRATLVWPSLPLMPLAESLAKAGHVTGASGRNWRSYGHEIRLPDGFPATSRDILTDPQTSGGLLVACTPDATAAVLRIFSHDGFAQARIIGHLSSGPAGLTIEA
ncbi:MAG: selenide, water dikinase SelD [Alphaproteobacteria bacterium]